ncbi:hypothetical protein ACWDE9_42215, partial [Streptomyces olivaceoviridis]
MWKGNTLNVRYEASDKFTRLCLKKEDISERGRRVLRRFVHSADCPDCGGTRLGPAALACRIG